MYYSTPYRSPYHTRMNIGILCGLLYNVLEYSSVLCTQRDLMVSLFPDVCLHPSPSAPTILTATMIVRGKTNLLLLSSLVLSSCLLASELPSQHSVSIPMNSEFEQKGVK